MVVLQEMPRPVFLLAALLAGTVSGLLPSRPPAKRATIFTPRDSQSFGSSRRSVIGIAAASGMALWGSASPAAALIKGSAPPPKSGPKERKCKSIDECEAMGEKAKQAAMEGQRTDFERTNGGDRYRDLTVGEGEKVVTQGDAVSIRYRVMRLGTKASDGLSGEGQTIFSFGYGEDEDKEGDSLPVQLSGQNLIPGVNDALLGMKPGGRRRVLVRPERGWKDQTGSCANLVFKADIGAAVENENACQNKVSLPQPTTYGGKARFGRRFDESLLVELVRRGPHKRDG